MTAADIPYIRLINQQIAFSKFTSAKELVSWMGAMQAQDFQMVKWAIGLRVPGSADNLITAAIDSGDIIRTHLLRPTWHFAAKEDLHWMLTLSSPKIKAAMKYRNKRLELSEKIYNKSNKILEEALEGGKHLSREELIARLEKAHIATDNNRASHLLMRAELECILCSGRTSGKKNTYALFKERIPEIKKLDRNEALALLAHRYFTSRSPATLDDFSWWSGLSITDAKLAYEMIKPDFILEKIGDRNYLHSEQFKIPQSIYNAAFVLPAYDELILSYSDRSAVLPVDYQKGSIYNNGVFMPFILIKGKIWGVWKRIFLKNEVLIETKYFRTPTKKEILLIEKAFGQFGIFLNKKIKIVHKTT